MQMLEMFYDQIQDAVDRKVPFVIPIGTMDFSLNRAVAPIFLASSMLISRTSTP